MESLYGQARDEQLPMHVGVVVPPLTRTNLAGDDMSIWEMVESGLRAKGVPAALIEPEEFAPVIPDGLRKETFWIEADVDADREHFGGRSAEGIARMHRTIQAKAAAMIDHTAPDAYLW